MARTLGLELRQLHEFKHDTWFSLQYEQLLPFKFS